MFNLFVSFLGQSLKGFATVKGVNRTKYDNPVGENIVDPGQDDARVQVQIDSYEATALASGSVIEIGKALPAGARIQQIVVDHDALGSATIDVGDADDADRYDTAISVSSAGQVFCNNIAGKNYKVGTADGDDQVILTTASAAITGTIKVAVYFTHA